MIIRMTTTAKIIHKRSSLFSFRFFWLSVELVVNWAVIWVLPDGALVVSAVATVWGEHSISVLWVPLRHLEWQKIGSMILFGKYAITYSSVEEYAITEAIADRVFILEEQRELSEIIDTKNCDQSVETNVFTNDCFIRFQGIRFVFRFRFQSLDHFQGLIDCSDGCQVSLSKLCFKRTALEGCGQWADGELYLSDETKKRIVIGFDIKPEAQRRRKFFKEVEFVWQSSNCSPNRFVFFEIDIRIDVNRIQFLPLKRITNLKVRSQWWLDSRDHKTYTECRCHQISVVSSSVQFEPSSDRELRVVKLPYQEFGVIGGAFTKFVADETELFCLRIV